MLLVDFPAILPILIDECCINSRPRSIIAQTDTTCTSAVGICQNSVRLNITVKTYVRDDVDPQLVCALGRRLGE